MFYTQALYVQSLTETHVDLLYSVVTNHETRLWALYIVQFDMVFFTNTRHLGSHLRRRIVIVIKIQFQDIRQVRYGMY